MRFVSVFSFVALCFGFGLFWQSGFYAKSFRAPTSDSPAESRLKNCAAFEKPQSDRLLLVAHRGDEQKYVENTYEAIVSGAQSGADYVEIDIRKSVDGVFLIHHDDRTGRVTGCSDGDVAIAESKWEYLRNKCRYKFVAPVSALINTFQEVLEITKNEEAGLVLDVKPEVQASDMQAFADELLKLDPQGRCLKGEEVAGTFNCFRRIIVYVNNYEAQDLLWNRVKGLEKVDAKYRILSNMKFLKIMGNPVDAMKYPEKYLNHDGLAFHLGSASCETLKALRAIPGKMMVGWTLQTKSELEDAKVVGLDAIVTSHLHDYLEYLKK